MKNASKWLIYASLVFVGVALARADYLRVPTIHDAWRCGASIVLLFAGFVADAWAWVAVTRSMRLPCTLREALAGCGLSIFGKYIPGKIWMVVGRAAYCAERHGGAFKEYSLAALTGQLITLWLGLALGAVGLVAIGAWRIWGAATLVMWLGLSLVLFTRIAHDLAERFAAIVLKRQIQLPAPSALTVLTVTPAFLVNWGLWTLGFQLLAESMVRGAVAWPAALSFPLSATLGILALLAPGGLGVREGVMVGYLKLCGLALEDAITLAAASRLWFLLGECFAFALGFACHQTREKAEERVAA